MTLVLRNLVARVLEQDPGNNSVRSTSEAVLERALEKGEVTPDSLYDELRFTGRGSILRSVQVEVEPGLTLQIHQAMTYCERTNHAAIKRVALTALCHYTTLEYGNRLHAAGGRHE